MRSSEDFKKFKNDILLQYKEKYNKILQVHQNVKPKDLKTLDKTPLRVSRKGSYTNLLST